jgi:hypothetical protein
MLNGERVDKGLTIMLDTQLQGKLIEFYQAEMMRKAAEARRAKPPQTATHGKTSTRKPVLARVGKLLSTMGDNLQERYDGLDKQTAQQNEYQLPA